MSQPAVACSISAGFAASLGFSIEIGTVSDGKNTKSFFSYGSSSGIYASVQENMYKINSIGNSHFNVNDWGGESYSASGGYWYVGGGYGGNAKSGYPEDSWPNTYSFQKISAGPLGLETIQK